MRAFQEQHKIVDLDTQAKAVVSHSASSQRPSTHGNGVFPAALDVSRLRSGDAQAPAGSA